MRNSVQAEITAADPARGVDAAGSGELVREMARDARCAVAAGASARIPWWRRRRTLIPLGVLGVAMLTGAAIMIPLGLWINGTKVQLDAEIPVVYTTDTGVEVSCRYGMSTASRSGVVIGSECIAVTADVRRRDPSAEDRPPSLRPDHPNESESS